MKRDPKPFLQGPPVLWRCTPLSMWLKHSACDYNRERIAQALKGSKNDVEALSARIQLAKCDGCPGVLVRFQQELEPYPKDIQPLAQLVTNAPPLRPKRQRMAIVLNRENPLTRYRAPLIPTERRKLAERSPLPPRPESARHLNARADKGGLIYYERIVSGIRMKFSTGTRDWQEAARIRDEFERDQGFERPASACACGCGAEVVYSGRGRIPKYAPGHARSA